RAARPVARPGIGEPPVMMEIGRARAFALVMAKMRHWPPVVIGQESGSGQATSERLVRGADLEGVAALVAVAAALAVAGDHYVQVELLEPAQPSEATGAGR
ncbi:MAG: hypothetical protein ACREMB_02615, partial [Candidatus Rokuibacteriota bacterium]